MCKLAIGIGRGLAKQERSTDSSQAHGTLRFHIQFQLDPNAPIIVRLNPAAEPGPPGPSVYSHRTTKKIDTKVLVSARAESEDRGYDDFFKDFDSPLMRRLRLEAYGKDIGKHSWLTAEELEEDIPRLALSHTSRFLDLGCGPCGPLAFIAAQVGCHSSGTDLSAEALAAGRARAASLGLDRVITLHQTDLNGPIPFVSGSFDAVMSLDVMSSSS
jgi:hypothetical protein